MNLLEINVDHHGAVVRIEGFQGITVRCPRCLEELASGTEHRCGDKLTSRTRVNTRCRPKRTQP